MWFKLIYYSLIPQTVVENSDNGLFLSAKSEKSILLTDMGLSVSANVCFLFP